MHSKYKSTLNNCFETNRPSMTDEAMKSLNMDHEEIKFEMLMRRFGRTARIQQQYIPQLAKSIIKKHQKNQKKMESQQRMAMFIRRMSTLKSVSDIQSREVVKTQRDIDISSSSSISARSSPKRKVFK